MDLFKKNLGSLLIKNQQELVILERKRMFKINEIAARIYDLCDGKTTLEEMCKELKNIYDVEENDLKNDIHEFTNQLLKLNLIKPV